MSRTPPPTPGEPFYTVPQGEWLLGSGIGAARRRRLEGAEPYGTLVDLIGRQAGLIDHRRQKAKQGNLFRICLTLSVAPGTVDRFHNSASGYRAQYYHSAGNGKRANAYTLQHLTPRILALLTGNARRTCPLWWVERSLLDATAKVWIHQGRWLRLSSLADRQLRMARWAKHETSSDRKLRKRAIWASLTPSQECRIDVKGGFLSLAGKHGESVKPERAREIRRFGFT